MCVREGRLALSPYAFGRNWYLCRSLSLASIAESTTGLRDFPSAAVWVQRFFDEVEPVFPEYAQRVPVRGPVILEVVANEKGEVVEAKVVKGGNPVVQKPVADAVKQWRYSPTYVDGKAVSVKFGVTFPIVLKK